MRNDLERKCQAIGERDLLTANIAQARGMVVVTDSAREFARISALSVEDWSQPL